MNDLFMDPYDCQSDWLPGCDPNNSTWLDIRKNLGYTLSYAKKMNLVSMLPHQELTSTGYALANPGSEYLVYQPGSGGFNVNLIAGDYNFEWFNPSSGSVIQTGLISASGGNNNFTPPFSGDAVLYLKLVNPGPTPSPTPTPTVNPSSTPTPTPSGLVVAYAINEGSGSSIADSSEFSNTGLLSGTSWITPGRYGSALSFNGTSSYVRVADPGSASVLDFAQGTSISIEMWIYPTTFPSRYSTLLTKGLNDGSDNLNYIFQIGDSGTTRFLEFCFNESSSLQYSCYKTNQTPVTLNTWQHVAMTFTFGAETSITIYHNAASLTGNWYVGNGSSAPDVNNLDVWIGADNYPGGVSIDEAYAGNIDEVRVYNKILTQAEIQNDMVTPIN